MKKIILSLIGLAFCGSLLAQTEEQWIDVRDRGEQINYPIVSQDHHLTFQGVSLGSDPEDFIRLLRQKGQDLGLNGNIPDGLSTGLSIGGYRIFDGGIREDCGFLYNLYASCTGFKSYEEAKKICLDIAKKFDKAYPIHMKDEKVFRDESSDLMNICSWRIFSNDKKYYLGAITLGITYSTQLYHSGYSIDIDYYDAFNLTQHDGISAGVFNISELATGFCQSCYLILDEDMLTFCVEKDGKQGVLYAYGADRSAILDYLNDASIDKVSKRNKLISYLRSIPFMDSDVPCGTALCFLGERKWDWYVKQQRELAALAKQQENNQRQQSTQKQQYGFGDMLMEMIFSKDEINYHKSLGTYDFLKGGMRGIMNSVGGNGGSYMDSLSPSQRAVIHEHDNGK
mgnify:CR=1 FL=1